MHPIETPHVLPLRDGEGTWHVRIVAETSDGRAPGPYNRPEAYHVFAERKPDARCAERATTSPTNAGRALGGARRRALELARTLACGAAVNCPGIAACIEGAPCPYGIAPKKNDAGSDLSA